MENPDYISRYIKQSHIVAVIEDTCLETPDPNVASYIKRGVYTFSNFKEARHFTTVINLSVDNPIAYRFNATNEENETND